MVNMYDGMARRILLVESHIDTRRVLALILKRDGFEVTTASTKAEAIALCDKQSFDLLISDIGLDGDSGLELMRELRTKCGIKGIAYTGYGFESDVAEAKAAGFSAHLLKPVDNQTLLQTIHSLLAEGSVN